MPISQKHTRKTNTQHNSTKTIYGRPEVNKKKREEEKKCVSVKVIMRGWIKLEL